MSLGNRIIAELENGVKPWLRPWDPEKTGGPHVDPSADVGITQIAHTFELPSQQNKAIKRIVCKDLSLPTREAFLRLRVPIRICLESSKAAETFARLTLDRWSRTTRIVSCCRSKQDNAKTWSQLSGSSSCLGRSTLRSA